MPIDAEFAREFRDFVKNMNDSAEPSEPAVRRRIREHFGREPTELPVVGDEVAQYDRVNLQLALDAWSAEPQRQVQAVGTGSANRFMGVELSDLVAMATAHGSIHEGPVTFAEISVGTNHRVQCYEMALLFIRDAGEPFVALIARGQQRSPQAPPTVVQVMGADRDRAAALLGDWRARRELLNVYRGQVLQVTQGDRNNPFGGAPRLSVVDTGASPRGQVILAEGVLETIERHTIEFAKHSDRMAAAGRTLRRGILLYGPPGTGKTHTVRYLCGALQGRTTFIISGPALGVVPQICRMARELAPAMVVLEDVDLVASERTMPGMSHTLLFELMNEMDGVASDIDIIFVLTTNRADVLEPALAARPGRIDLAVELPLPDAACRRRLVELYRFPLEIEPSVTESIVERTEGVSAAFIRELLRRATLIAATANTDPLRALTRAQVDQALDELLTAGGRLTRALLGAANSDDNDAPPFNLPPGVRLPPGVDIRAFQRAGIFGPGLSPGR